MGLASTTDIIGPKAAKFAKITQNNGHYAVHCHSRSSISVPMESLYATSYVLFFVTDGMFFRAQNNNEIQH